MTEEEQNDQGGGPAEGDAEVQRQFSIQRIYMKDMSFETPHSPAIFTVEWKPEVNMNLSSESAQLAKGIYDVVLSMTVTVKIGDKTAFLAEVNQAGIFNIQGFPEEELKHMLGSYCPNILFPYVREAVSDLVTRGGFPQFIMAPVNFDALYVQQQKRAQEEPTATH